MSKLLYHPPGSQFRRTAMTNDLKKRLDQLKQRERDLRDQSSMSQSSLDSTLRLDGKLTALSSEIANLERAS